MYPNLDAEMARQKVLKKELARELGITEKTMSAKLSGDADFKISEMRYIKKRFCKTLDYLFDTEPEAQGAA